MVLHDDPRLPFPEFMPHVRFLQCRILRTEFQGSRYLVWCSWQGLTLIAYSTAKPHASTVDLGIRLSDILVYTD
jgi:hypothetical protein